MYNYNNMIFVVTILKSSLVDERSPSEDDAVAAAALRGSSPHISGGASKWNRTP